MSKLCQKSSVTLVSDLSLLELPELLSEHLEPETVSFHCHSPQLTVLFVVHDSFTSTHIILIGIAKLSQMRWIVYSWELPEKSLFDFLFKNRTHRVHFIL